MTEEETLGALRLMSELRDKLEAEHIRTSDARGSLFHVKQMLFNFPDDASRAHKIKAVETVSESYKRRLEEQFNTLDEIEKQMIELMASIDDTLPIEDFIARYKL